MNSATVHWFLESVLSTFRYTMKVDSSFSDFKRLQKTAENLKNCKRPNKTEQLFNIGNFAEQHQKKRFKEGKACAASKRLSSASINKLPLFTYKYI